MWSFVSSSKPGATKWNIPEHWQPVAEIMYHPFHTGGRRRPTNKLSYNVGLIKLKNRVNYLLPDWNFLLGVRPICLPTPHQNKIEDLYGKQVLQTIELKVSDAIILSNEECVERYPEKYRHAVPSDHKKS